MRRFKGMKDEIIEYLNVGKMTCSYSFVVASWTIAKAGWSTAAKNSACLISCCKQGQTCCHHSFCVNIIRNETSIPMLSLIFLGKRSKINFYFEASLFNLRIFIEMKAHQSQALFFFIIIHIFIMFVCYFCEKNYSNSGV